MVCGVVRIWIEIHYLKLNKKIFFFIKKKNIFSLFYVFIYLFWDKMSFRFRKRYKSLQKKALDFSCLKTWSARLGLIVFKASPYIYNAEDVLECGESGISFCLIVEIMEYQSIRIGSYDIFFFLAYFSLRAYFFYFIQPLLKKNLH